MLGVWRASKRTLPSFITGVGPGSADGDANPGGALFNMLFIRLPFLSGCAVLALNVLLGGGLTLGDTEIPIRSTQSGW